MTVNKKFVEECKKEIFANLKFFNGDIDSKKEINYLSLARAIEKDNYDTIDKIVQHAMCKTYVKIEEAVNELHSSKMMGAASGAHFLALACIVMTMAIKSIQIPSLKEVIEEDFPDLAISDKDAYESLIESSFAVVYKLSADRNFDYDTSNYN